jgi:hypothetical protein
MSLFDDFDRTLVGGAGNLITSYDYLNEFCAACSSGDTWKD